GDRVALVDAGEVLDLVGIELLQLLGDREAVGARVLEHAGGAVEAFVDDGGAARPAELRGGDPLRAPVAADVMADRLAAEGAEVAGLPVGRLGLAAALAPGAHAISPQRPGAHRERAPKGLS